VTENTIFKLVLKKPATSKDNVQLNYPHSNALLPTYICVEYFGNCQVRQPPTHLSEWKLDDEKYF